MNPNALTALRLALPGEPPLRDLAPKIGCSHTHLASFERGEARLTRDQLVKLAKIVRLDVAEIERRFWFVALERAERDRLEARTALLKLGVKDPRRKPSQKSA